MGMNMILDSSPANILAAVLVTVDLAPIGAGAARRAATIIVTAKQIKLLFIVKVLNELKDDLRWIISLFVWCD